MDGRGVSAVALGMLVVAAAAATATGGTRSQLAAVRPVIGTLPAPGASPVGQQFVLSPRRARLVVTVRGKGTVVSSPPGISCSTACRAWFARGRLVTLRARAEDGWRLSGWRGPCAKQVGSVCTVRMSAQRSIQATFTKNSPPPLSPAYGTIKVTGPEQIVFDSASTNCGEWYGPDLPAHAIRSAEGKVRLYISWWSTRAMVGRDLDHLSYDCSLVLSSHWNDDVVAFDDTEWLAAPYTSDGKTVHSLVHMERHLGTPGGQPGFDAVTLASSHDGGRSFQHATPPSQLVATIPDQLAGRPGRWGWNGMGGPSNIVHGPGGFYYAFAGVSDSVAPAGEGTCLLRANDLSDPASWTAWNDRTGGWTTTFVNPYLVQPADRAAHLCQPLAALWAIPGGFQAESLTYSSYLERYLLVGEAIADEPGFYFTTSTDLLHWSKAQLIAKMPLRGAAVCATEQVAQYPSVIDPASSSPSFETVGQTAYLYYTRWHACTNVTLDSDLVRVPIEFSK